MRILVTGKDGQVGGALQDIAASRDDLEVIALDRQALDITDKQAVLDCVAVSDCDAVINAAAYTAVDKAEEDRETAFAVNRDASGFLAEACADKNIPLIHISTDFVFDGRKSGAYQEDDLCAPLGIYGQSKLEGEQRINRVGGKYLILRTAWVFGGKANFVNTMKRLAKDRPEISVVADQRGGPTAAQDIAACLLVMADKAIEPDFADWGIYHYVGAPSVSWYEFASEILKDYPGVTVNPIPTSGYPTPAARPANSVLDCTKIQTVFGLTQPDWRQRL